MNKLYKSEFFYDQNAPATTSAHTTFSFCKLNKTTPPLLPSIHGNQEEEASSQAREHGDGVAGRHGHERPRCSSSRCRWRRWWWRRRWSSTTSSPSAQPSSASASGSSSASATAPLSSSSSSSFPLLHQPKKKQDKDLPPQTPPFPPSPEKPKKSGSTRLQLTFNEDGKFMKFTKRSCGGVYLPVGGVERSFLLCRREREATNRDWEFV